MRIHFAALLLVMAVIGCKNPGKSGLFNGPISPTLSGAWDGTFQMGGSTPTMSMAITQSNINIRGDYFAPALSGVTIGNEGTVTGLTTGQSFNITLTATTPGCVSKIDVNGYNAGDELAFNFSGVDCSCTTVSGQGYGQRP